MCGPGFYSDTTMDYCQVSWAGYYAINTQISAPTANPNGYWSDVGFVTATRTLPNRELRGDDGRHTVQCQPGEFLKDYVCTPAAAGTFAPLGYSTSGHRSAGITCPDGTWSFEGSIECKTCRPGYSCSDKVNLVECAANQY